MKLQQRYIDPSDALLCGSWFRSVHHCKFRAWMSPRRVATYTETNTNTLTAVISKFQLDSSKKQVTDVSFSLYTCPWHICFNCTKSFQVKRFARANCSKSSTATGCGCFACGHCARSAEGQPGVCKRSLQPCGSLFVPLALRGHPMATDREKTLLSMLSGALAYRSGMSSSLTALGLCQNWVTSQALRDPCCCCGPMRGHARRTCQTPCAWEAESSQHV